MTSAALSMNSTAVALRQSSAALAAGTKSRSLSNRRTVAPRTNSPICRISSVEPASTGSIRWLRHNWLASGNLADGTKAIALSGFMRAAAL